MPQPVALVIHGAAGRMGRSLVRLAQDRADLAIVSAIVRKGSDQDGQPVSGAHGLCESTLRFESTLPANAHADVMIDFAGASAFDAALRLSLERRIAFVSGSTGLSSSQHDALQRAGRDIPVLSASNFSLGVAVLARLVAQAARGLADWECEILETHHSRKRDAPSGTALLLGTVVDTARGNADRAVDTDRRGPRASGKTGYAVVRGGDVVGEHTVFLFGDGERLELAHRATDRDIFARGALSAALWITQRAAGVYSLDDVVGDALAR